MLAVVPQGSAAAAKEVAASTTAATLASTQNTAALQAQGVAAKKAAISQRELAASTAASAAALEQQRRGVLASLLSMLGIRGATLAAGQAFLIGAAGATVLAKSVQGASEDAEALADVTRQLGPQLGGQLAKNAEGLAVSFGLVDDEVLRFQAGVAQVFKSVGISSQQTVQFSSQLVKLAADIAAVKDVAATDVFTAFRSGLAGNVRGLKQFLGAINATIINQRALRDTGKESVSQLTEQEKVLARLEIITEKAARFTGGFAEEQQRLSGQSKTLRAEIDNLSDSLGGLLLGPVTNIVHILNLGAGAFISLKDAIAQVNIQIPILNKSLFELVNFFPLVIDLTSTLATKGFKSMGESGTSALERIAKETIISSQAFKDLVKPVQSIIDLLIRMGKEAVVTGGALNSAAASGRLFAANLKGLEGQFLDLQFAGAGPAALLGNLRERLADINKEIAGAAPGQRFALKTERNSIQSQITAILEQQAADAQAATDAANRAADEAHQAAEAQARLAEQQQAAADQAIQNRIDNQQALAQIKITNAESRAGLRDDIQAQVELKELLKRQIRGLVQQIKDQQQKTQTLLALKTALAQTKAAIKDLLREQRAQRIEAERLRQEQLAQAKAEALEGLRLQVQIADAEGNTNKEISALQRLIRAEEKQLAAMKKETNEKKRLRLQIAQDKAALAALKKETESHGNASRDFFEFLQRQQGFAVSLLGNLFPGGAASGALGVGATRGAGAAASDLFPQGAGPTGVGDVTGALAARAQIQAGAPRGTTQGQTQTVIEILRQILRVLQVQGRATADPEARFNRASGSAVMDIM